MTFVLSVKESYPRVCLYTDPSSGELMKTRYPRLLLVMGRIWGDRKQIGLFDVLLSGVPLVKWPWPLSFSPVQPDSGICLAPHVLKLPWLCVDICVSGSSEKGRVWARSRHT